MFIPTDSLSTIASSQNVSNLISEDLLGLFERLAITILGGVLIGLERESHVKKEGMLFAGVRTFPLISMLGFLAALISTFTSTWAFILIYFGFFLLVIATYIMTALEGERGITTESAALLVFLFGALIYWKFTTIAVAVTVVVMAFLSLQPQLSKLARNLVEEDIYATLKFAVITLIILPILPDETFGPFDVLNPRQIWYMVILIAGISFAGYLLVKFIGSDKAIPLTGLLGGLVSSTAVALSFSQKSKGAKDLSKHFAAAIVLASTIMFPRVLLEVFVINQTLFYTLILPISILIIVGLVTSVILWFSARSQAVESVELNNPFELWSAIKFGLIFAVILFVSKAAQVYLGTNGIYYASILGGLTDVDAVTLSMANLAKSSITEKVASTAIMMAILSNTIVKWGIAFFLGSSSLRKLTLPSYGLVFLVGIVLILFFV
jgi:uncharacterized membrane protein (DUF4010 family)